jgi:hypothetical protein
MPQPERPPSEDHDPNGAAELTWLLEHRIDFFAFARDRHAEYGRGAIVIELETKALLDDETAFQYAPQARIEQVGDEVSKKLADVVDAYDPLREFIAVFVHRPGGQIEFRIYQIGVGEIGLLESGTDSSPEQALDLSLRIAQINRCYRQAERLRLEEITDRVRGLN